MNESTIHLLRHIFQHHVAVHPVWNRENRQALKDLFNLDDEELNILHEFATWVCNHGLEQLTRLY